jgi:hypothetical protein
MRSLIPLFVLAFAASAPALAAEVVPVQPFRSVELHGGGDVTIVPGPVERVTLIQGSTRSTRMAVDADGKLVIDACYQQCPRNFDLQIRIESPRVPAVAIQGGGTIRASGGFAPQNELAAAVRGGGTIDLRPVDAIHVSAAVEGGGTIAVRPRSALAAAVRGGGEIRYSGNPQVSMAVAGGGDVRRVD